MRARPTFGLGGLVATALLTLGVSPASAQSNSTNTTIAYTDSAIHYEGGWTTDDKGAGVAYTADGNANFTINFAGTYCYLQSSRKYDRYHLVILVDGQNSGTADLWQAQSLGTSASNTIVWTKTGLSPGNHTLLAYNDGQGVGSQKQYVSLGSFVYGDGTPSSIPSPGTTGTTGSSGSSNGAVIGGAVGGVIGGLVLAGLGFFLFFYRRRRQSRKLRYEGPQKATAEEVLEDSPIRGSWNANGTSNFGQMGQVTPLPLPASAHPARSSLGLSFQHGLGHHGSISSSVGYGSNPASPMSDHHFSHNTLSSQGGTGGHASYNSQYPLFHGTEPFQQEDASSEAHSNGFAPSESYAVSAGQVSPQNGHEAGRRESQEAADIARWGSLSRQPPPKYDG